MKISLLVTVDAEYVSGMHRSAEEVAEELVSHVDGDFRVKYSVYDVSVNGWQIEHLAEGDRAIVLMCGDRHWKKRTSVRREIARLVRAYGRDKLLIVEGGADGADTIVNEEATKQGVHVATVPALWEHYHRAAGPQRNNWLLALRPREAIAFHPDIASSRGTADMIKKVERAGVPVKVVKK